MVKFTVFCRKTQEFVVVPGQICEFRESHNGREKFTALHINLQKCFSYWKYHQINVQKMSKSQSHALLKPVKCIYYTEESKDHYTRNLSLKGLPTSIEKYLRKNEKDSSKHDTW